MSSSESLKEQIRARLAGMAEASYGDFAAALIPNVNHMLGIRLPLLRKLAKEMVRRDWRSYLQEEPFYFEEAMLQGMIIGYIPVECQERLRYIAEFVPKINNWSVCDSFCSGLKFTHKNKNEVWAFIQSYLMSDKEYEIRFAVVMMLNYFMDEEHIPQVLDKLDAIRHEGYYVKMAVAWALSYCYIYQPELTLDYFSNHSLDQFTYNKALQKIVESNRVSPERKEQIRELR